MKAKGKFISFLLVVDTFFVAYAYGFHSRQVLVIDPKLPPVVHKKEMDITEKKESAGNAISALKAAPAKPLKKLESKTEKQAKAERQTKAVSGKHKASTAKPTNPAIK